MAVFHAVRVYPGSLARSMRLPFHKPATTTVHRFLSEEAATSKRRIDLRGIFPPIVTTFGPQGELAEREVPGNVARWLREPLRGLVVQGSNGESVLLTEEERVAIVHTVRACLPLDRLLIAGSGCEGTLQTLEMTKKMADAGADAVLVVTPAYYRGRMTIGAFVNHYTQVANDSPVPVILYSVPGNTALELPIEAVVTLAQHPNIIGMKDSGGDISRIATIIHATQKEDFQMLAGSASFLFAAYAVGSFPGGTGTILKTSPGASQAIWKIPAPDLHSGGNGKPPAVFLVQETNSLAAHTLLFENHGAVGGICGLANVLPGPLCKLDDAWWHGNTAEARELQLRLLRPNAAVTRRFGVPGVKQAMEWFGFHGGPCRPPLQALSPSEASMLRQEFVADGWLTN